MGRGADHKKNAAKYIKSAQERIILRSAARAWAHGVPWGAAVNLSRRAITKAAKGQIKTLPPKCGQKLSKAKPKAKAVQNEFWLPCSYLVILPQRDLYCPWVNPYYGYQFRSFVKGEHGSKHSYLGGVRESRGLIMSNMLS